MRHCGVIKCSSVDYTSFNSAGTSFLGCLFSKCCLYVFGSGICACKESSVTTEIIIKQNEYLANSTNMNQSLLCCLFLKIGIMPLLFLCFCCFFGGFRLGLKFLLSSSHSNLKNNNTQLEQKCLKIIISNNILLT